MDASHSQSYVEQGPKVSLGKPPRPNISESDVFDKIPDAALTQQLIHRTYEWVGPDSELSNIVYTFINRFSLQILQQEKSAIVDEIVQTKLLKHWQTNLGQKRLNEIASSLLTSAERRQTFAVYAQLLSAGSLPYNPSKTTAGTSQLLHAGIAIVDRQRLRPAGALFTQIFDTHWISRTYPDLLDADDSADTPQDSAPTHPPQPEPAAPELSQKNLYSPAFYMSGLKGLGYWLQVGGGIASAIALIALTTSLFQTIQTNRQQSLLISQQQYFERGTDHATNGRWLEAFREFCQIPPSSSHFATLEQKTAQWMPIYEQEIQQTRDVLIIEGIDPCPILDKAT